MYETASPEEIAQKEKEMICLYGRILAGGILVNISPGGEGVHLLGKKKSPESIQKRTALFYEKGYYNRTAEQIEKMNEWKLVPVIQLDLSGNILNEFPSIKAAGASLGKNGKTAIAACARGNVKSALGYKWIYKNGQARQPWKSA